MTVRGRPVALGDETARIPYSRNLPERISVAWNHRHVIPATAGGTRQRGIRSGRIIS
jgi:hypothetical protein